MERGTEYIVRQLIEINMERMHEYLSASQFVKEPRGKKLLSDLSAQSEGFMMELEYFLKLYGGSVGGAASQTLAYNPHKFKSAESDEAIFFIILQQECKVKETYNRMLSDGMDLDNTLFEKIRTQKSDLLESEERLNSLRS